MKEPLSTLSCHKHPAYFSVEGLHYGANGPYSFNCAANECLGIRGVTGVGKTLLLRVLADLDRHEGKILLSGKECSTYSAPDWRRHVALVPAESRWWYSTVGSHITAGEKEVDIGGLLAPLGFEKDVLDWDVKRLSSGEKQRLAVVRALVHTPSVLLLDETGSGLDHQSCLLLEGLVNAYQHEYNAAVLWVSHDDEQLERVAQRIMSLERNRLKITPGSRPIERVI
jgi:ABC-type iron transport system FetAB ATPase subunit